MFRLKLLAQICADGVLDAYDEIDYVFEFGRTFEGRPAQIVEVEDEDGETYEEIELVADGSTLDDIIGAGESDGFNATGDFGAGE